MSARNNNQRNSQGRSSTGSNINASNRTKQRGSNNGTHQRSSFNGNVGPTRQERFGPHSSSRPQPGMSQHSLDQQWSLAGNAWGAWNTHQHFHAPAIYPGDFRVYGPVMPLQAVSAHGDYHLFAANHSNGHQNPSHMHFYRPYVEYPSGRSRGLVPEEGHDEENRYMDDDREANDFDESFVERLSPSQMSPQTSEVSGISARNNQDFDEYQSSEDDEDDDSENGSHYQSIISATFEKYESESTTEDAGKISKLLLEVCQSGAVSCLICISSVKRSQPVWSCGRCCCMYHLQCIQKWARDSVDQIKLRAENQGVARVDANISWDCPKCRLDYPVSMIPEHYYCFCGKTRDPDFDPWLVPHSCGQSCDKALVSPFDPTISPTESCGHRCTLLCHPGPCPPCPQTVQVRCQCGASSPQPRRCSAQIWTCSNTCGKLLSCGKHQCTDFCHPGKCAECKVTLVEKCECGLKEKLVMCSGVGWKCDTVCDKMFPCGKHRCDKACHPSDGDFCGECPNSGNRTCPCGKQLCPGLNCTDVAPLCENRCGRDLTCGQHRCELLCHHGDCGPCRQQVTKRCPCGKKSRQVQCSQAFSCETKCGKFKNCGRHQCKKKCCTGTCQPCEQVCMKNLACGNHRCQQICHSGPCYPCQQTKCLSCPCGATSIQIPCGREKLVKKPNCQKNCLRPPACHHKSLKQHKCHSGYCPPCDLTCEKPIEKCGHLCLATCHSAVWTKYKPKNLLNNETVQFKQVEQPCPPCRTQIEISCFGQHESINIQCAKGKTYSCGSPCGRLLSCGNHQCERICHVVQTAPDESTVNGIVMAGADCDVCERGCELERPEGCTHQCPMPCHCPPCQPCTIKVYKRCLCSHLTLMISCNVWTESNEAEKKVLLNGNHPCPVQMDCGHACPRGCHPVGGCLPADQCTKRATVKCACGSSKQETLCKNVPITAPIPCTKVCEQRLEKRKRKQKEKRPGSKDNDDADSESVAIDKQYNFSSSLSSRNGGDRRESNQDSQKFKNEVKERALEDSKSSAGKNVTTRKAKNSTKLLVVKPNSPKVPFYKKAHCIPLVLAFLAIFAGIYISITAELEA